MCRAHPFLRFLLFPAAAPPAIARHAPWPSSRHFDDEPPTGERSGANSFHPHTVARPSYETVHHNCEASSPAYICNRINNTGSVGSQTGSCRLCVAFLRCHILDISSPYFTHSFATPRIAGE